MEKAKHLDIEIHYTKVADKFFEKHQDVRKQYEDAIIPDFRRFTQIIVHWKD